MAPNQRVTSVEIAQRLGISQSTVSRALSGDPRVKEETRERVVRTAREMGYVPNAAASFLKRGHVGALGLLVDEHSEGRGSSHWYVDRVLRELARACSKAEINLSFDQTQMTSAGLRTRFHRNRVDGVIVTSVSDVEGVCRSLDELALPYILLRRRHPADAAPYVDSADDEGMRRIVRFLYDLGHRRIAFLGTGSLPSKQRARGFIQAHQDLDLPVNDEWIIQRPNPVELVGNLFYQDPRPTAIACYDDRRAFDLLRWCQVHGVQVPGDLSITGFGDEEISEFLTPAMTTVHIPVRSMVDRAVEALLAAVRERRRPEIRETFPVYLIERQTTAPPRAT